MQRSRRSLVNVVSVQKVCGSGAGREKNGKVISDSVDQRNEFSFWQFAVPQTVVANTHIARAQHFRASRVNEHEEMEEEEEEKEEEEQENKI